MATLKIVTIATGLLVGGTSLAMAQYGYGHGGYGYGYAAAPLYDYAAPGYGYGAPVGVQHAGRPQRNLFQEIRKMAGLRGLYGEVHQLVRVARCRRARRPGFPGRTLFVSSRSPLSLPSNECGKHLLSQLAR